jgi:import inner membrane translocase subunit TIM54
LVAAGIDYEYPLTPPIIHGSVARSTHALILAKRRQALGLEPRPIPMSFPGAMDPSSEAQRELEGGTVLVGRASFKEYMEGLKRGWMGGVNPWSLEDDVKKKVEGDGAFDDPATATLRDAATAAAEQDLSSADLKEITPSPLPSAPTNPTGLGFLSRPTPPPFSLNSPNANTPSIPAHLHLPPSPLPPQPPILFLPYTNHMGFKAFPYFIYQFFTERHRVRAGSEAALALIQSQTRPDEGVQTEEGTGKLIRQGGDLDFDLEGESFIRKSFKKFPGQIETARKDYYEALKTRVESVMDLQAGRREMTDNEKSGKTKVEMIEEMKDERIKKEMRWCGGEDGYEIVKPETPVVWDPRWDGWLRVFVKPDDKSGTV